jgi:hypothetical protein
LVSSFEGTESNSKRSGLCKSYPAVFLSIVGDVNELAS